jgi:hypothetical protein
MSNNPHADDKAHACQSSLRAFEDDHLRAPNTHEKARLISIAIGEWERKHIAETHPWDEPAAAAPDSGTETRN